MFFIDDIDDEISEGVEEPENFSLATVYQSFWKGEEYIFAGLDTCANIDSNPVGACVRSLVKYSCEIATSGGGTDANLRGSFPFTVRDFQNKSIQMTRENCYVLPGSQHPLLSVSLLEKIGWFTEIPNRVLYNKHTYEQISIVELNGLFGIWIKPYSLERDNKRKRIPVSNSNTRVSVNPIQDRYLDSQMRFSNFEKYNETRGAFTHQIFTTEKSRCVDQFLKSDGWEDTSFAGLSLIVTPNFWDNESVVTLLTKMDDEFKKNPHDIKYLLILKKSPQSSWWNLLCNYETIDTIKTGDYFYTYPADRLLHPVGNEWKCRGIQNDNRIYDIPLPYDIVTLPRYYDSYFNKSNNEITLQVYAFFSALPVGSLGKRSRFRH